MPRPPKYQVIHAELRDRILRGELGAGERLPSQHELATSFGVTLMTLRQAVAALEADGLVRTERGRGTFVADRPVDVRIGNLSSFAAEMRAAGAELRTDVLDVTAVAAAAEPEVAALLGATELVRLVRLRTVDGVRVALQRSYLDAALGAVDPGTGLVGESLYDAIRAASGTEIAEARESIDAVRLGRADAELLDATRGAPALRSVRTSLDRFGRPFLHDVALLVGDRCSIVADRSADRLRISYGVSGVDAVDETSARR